MKSQPQGVCCSCGDIPENNAQQRSRKWCPGPGDGGVVDELLAQDSPVQATENTRKEITGQRLQAAVSRTHHFMRHTFIFFPCNSPLFLRTAPSTQELYLLMTTGIFLSRRHPGRGVSHGRCGPGSLLFPFCFLPRGAHTELFGWLTGGSLASPPTERATISQDHLQGQMSCQPEALCRKGPWLCTSLCCSLKHILILISVYTVLFFESK